MVVALRGTINGNIISFARAQGDRWEAIIPKSLNGAYVVDMSAVDEAGNIAYIAKNTKEAWGECQGYKRTPSQVPENFGNQPS